MIKDKNKNKIIDKKVANFIVRQQVLSDFPPKELRSVIDQGKKEINEGIIISISTFEEKVGIAVGVTSNLASKYDAVKFVKVGSETIGGKGGGGRKDFAQSGGIFENKIDEAFSKLKNLI